MNQYLDRWSNASSGKPFKFSESDWRILNLFNRVDGYKLLAVNQIQALLPDITATWLADRVRELAREPHEYLEWRTFAGKSQNTPFFYALTEKGADKLGHKNVPPLKKHDEEQALIDHFDVCIQASRNKHQKLELLKWNKILQHPSMPEETKNSDYPLVLRYLDTKALPDGRPFVLKNERGAVAFFKEVDRATEPLTSKRPREHIKQKFVNYKRLWDARAYKTQYGFPAAMILFTTTEKQRMENMMKLLGPCSYIAFQLIHDFTIMGTQPIINDAFYANPWKRNGYPDYYLSTLSEQPCNEIPPTLVHYPSTSFTFSKR